MRTKRAKLRKEWVGTWLPGTVPWTGDSLGDGQVDGQASRAQRGELLLLGCNPLTAGGELSSAAHLPDAAAHWPFKKSRASCRQTPAGGTPPPRGHLTSPACACPPHRRKPI
eukprot:3811015-Pleurochrysis_carterae.AAC.1